MDLGRDRHAEDHVIALGLFYLDAEELKQFVLGRDFHQFGSIHLLFPEITFCRPYSLFDLRRCRTADHIF